MTAYKDFCNMLHEEHLQVMDMLNQLKEMPDSDMSGREEMFTRLKSALAPHMKAEEKAYYPILRQNTESKMDAMEAMEEHHIAEVSMMELDKMSKDEEFWAPKLSVFRELINHHVQEEESKVFKDTKDYLSEDQIQEISQNFQEAKESAKSNVKTASSRK
jgi:hemerythrin-like domain-containing protein